MYGNGRTAIVELDPAMVGLGALCGGARPGATRAGRPRAVLQLDLDVLVALDLDAQGQPGGTGLASPAVGDQARRQYSM
eukprot:CAMPEP_0116975684 /NCGR_PEP_ID=MMETSP0467-20121206/55965_1 /TAXON_ID=283647 /ORGANISM="Mesodinium pulex, Strain SPMC105" /LENGTH=78 /DNA_ID=CAMNT_0004668175 /DNA_START=23 /DNA_END=260 /DNA_ORIENTATION=-